MIGNYRWRQGLVPGRTRVRQHREQAAAVPGHRGAHDHHRRQVRPVHARRERRGLPGQVHRQVRAPRARRSATTCRRKRPRPSPRRSSMSTASDGSLRCGRGVVRGRPGGDPAARRATNREIEPVGRTIRRFTARLTVIAAASCPRSASAARSSRREPMPSLLKILRRCHSTVRPDRNSWAPISGFERPSAASRAIFSSWGVRSSRAGRPLASVPPAPCSSRSARSAKPPCRSR